MHYGGFQLFRTYIKISRLNCDLRKLDNNHRFGVSHRSRSEHATNYEQVFEWRFKVEATVENITITDLR